MLCNSLKKLVENAKAAGTPLKLKVSLLLKCIYLALDLIKSDIFGIISSFKTHLEIFNSCEFTKIFSEWKKCGQIY